MLKSTICRVGKKGAATLTYNVWIDDGKISKANKTAMGTSSIRLTNLITTSFIVKHYFFQKVTIANNTIINKKQQGEQSLLTNI